MLRPDGVTGCESDEIGQKMCLGDAVGASDLQMLDAPFFQKSIVNVPSEIFPFFWYDTIKPPLQYVAQAATPLKRLVQGKEYADKGRED